MRVVEVVQGHLGGLLVVKGNMVQDLVGDLQNIQCLSAGHYQSHCWSSQGRNFEEGSSSSNKSRSSEYGSLFMVHNGEEVHNSSIWLFDSGTSNI